MSAAHGIFQPPTVTNEAPLDYAPGSPERESLLRRLHHMRGERLDIPMVIGGKDIRTGRIREAVEPHRHKSVLADVHEGDEAHVADAIDAAASAWREWHAWPWEERAGVFLRAAELLAGPWRETLLAATMLGQSKTVREAEIDAAAELIDLFRFNAAFMTRIYAEQPLSGPGMWNRMEYRPLEGFVLAVTPFNFTSIAANLPSAPALMGNTVLWKPAETAMVSAYWVMRLLQAAGLPDGVINLVYGPGPEIGRAALASPDLAGVHFTGSTAVFQQLWRTVGANVASYRNYPRLVGETGGKDFILVHPSADVDAVATAIVRGAFEYQGQKCSAASRVFAPSNLWPQLRETLQAQVAELAVGDVADFGNFLGAVIDDRSFARQRAAIAEARAHDDSDIVVGGGCDDADGFFVEPTVIQTRDPGFRLLSDELFGPVVTSYVYDERRWTETLDLIDGATPYGLTGAVFAQDRAAVQTAQDRLRYTAGNFYINDKPAGAVIGQQPFGGARASGTNDKAGSLWNLTRWVTPRTVKETFVPPRDYRYAFMEAEDDGPPVAGRVGVEDHAATGAGDA